MTAVTLSPHQLASLQQQHRNIPTTHNSSRPAPPPARVSLASSSHHLGRTTEQTGTADELAETMENSRPTLSEIPGQKAFLQGSLRGGNGKQQIDLNDRSNIRQNPSVHNSNSSFSASDEQSQQLPNHRNLERRNTRSNLASSNTQVAAPVPAPIVALPQNPNDVAVPVADRINNGRPKKQLLRAKSDLGPRGTSPTGVDGGIEEENWKLRHGWEDQYNSNEYLSILTSVSKINLLRAHVLIIPVNGISKRRSLIRNIDVLHVLYRQAP